MTLNRVKAETKKRKKINFTSTDLMKQNVTLKFLHHNRAKQGKNAKTQQRKEH